MHSRRLPHSTHSTTVGWTHKTLALAMHVTGLLLFGLTVVWPVASPIVRGELAREFQPVLQAWAAWTAQPAGGSLRR